jgi:hypothetical protein
MVGREENGEDPPERANSTDALDRHRNTYITKETS